MESNPLSSSLKHFFLTLPPVTRVLLTIIILVHIITCIVDMTITLFHTGKRESQSLPNIIRQSSISTSYLCLTSFPKFSIITSSQLLKFGASFLLSPYIHFSIMHLLFNGMVLTTTGSAVEHHLGSSPFFILYCCLHLMSNTAIVFVYTTRFILPACVGGFSGILFGLMGVEAYRMSEADPDAKMSLCGFVLVRCTYVPWILLMITLLLAPESSFLGHLSGLLSGIALVKVHFFFDRIVIPLAQGLDIVIYRIKKILSGDNGSSAGLSHTGDTRSSTPFASLFSFTQLGRPSQALPSRFESNSGSIATMERGDNINNFVPFQGPGRKLGS